MPKLEDVLRAAEVLQPMLAEVELVGSRWQALLGECPGGRRKEYLAAIARQPSFIASGNCSQSRVLPARSVNRNVMVPGDRASTPTSSIALPRVFGNRGARVSLRVHSSHR